MTATTTRKHYSEDQIRYILTSATPLTPLAKEMGCSRSLIHDIRTGNIYADRCPDIPRIKPDRSRLNRTCRKCIHFSPKMDSVSGHLRVGCALGIPECVETSGQFGAYCNTFVEESNGN